MSVVFCMPPSKQSISHKWQTGIQKSINGVEKRSALYTWFRMGIECEYITGVNSESVYIRNHWKKDMTDTWYIPIFADKTTLASAATLSGTTLQCVETADRHFYDGRDAVIVNPSDWTDYEQVTITTVSGNYLLLDAELDSAWNAASRVYPLYGCRIAAAQELTKQVREIDRWSLEFVEKYETDRTFSYTDATWDVTTYSGIDIFMPAPAREFTQTYNHPYDLTQWIGKGLAYTWYAEGQTEMGEQNEYIFGNRGANHSRSYVRDILDFFDKRKGRWGAFLVPTWNKDIVVNTTFSGSQTELLIDESGYVDNYLGDDIMGKYIMFRFTPNDFVIRRLVWADSGHIKLDQAIGTDVLTQAGVNRLYISYLVYSRFDQDDIVIEYNYAQDSIAELTLNFMGLVEEAP